MYFWEWFVRRGRRRSFLEAEVADSRKGAGDSAGNLLIEPDQLRGALADIGGECLRLGLPGSPCSGRTAG